ncbi:MAG TPA: hypothetical protein VKA48_05995, partial [Gammaproteobacteria bacterium]|nr:hypothetical protein [Gammaproteobacteria bacterium]
MGYPTAQNYQKHFSEMSPNEIRKSLKYNLLKVFSPEEKKILLSKRFPKRYRGHIGAGQVRELAGEDVWNDYLKFSIERNPWDRVVSLFHFQKKRPYQAYESVNELGFREFVLGGYGYQPNFELYSINGIPAMDRIIRYEDLGPGLSDLSRTLGLPADLSESMQNIKAKGGVPEQPGIQVLFRRGNQAGGGLPVRPGDLPVRVRVLGENRVNNDKSLFLSPALGDVRVSGLGWAGLLLLALGAGVSTALGNISLGFLLLLLLVTPEQTWRTVRKDPLFYLSLLFWGYLGLRLALAVWEWPQDAAQQIDAAKGWSLTGFMTVLVVSLWISRLTRPDRAIRVLLAVLLVAFLAEVVRGTPLSLVDNILHGRRYGFGMVIIEAGLYFGV